MSGAQPLRRLAAVVGALVVVPLFAVVGGADPSRSELDLVAEFTDAAAIVSGSDVKVDGVLAGRVGDIELHDGRARLSFTLGPEFTPVHADATVRIRPASLLGEQFVDLDRGTPEAPPLRDGAVIPPSNTSRAVDLQDVLNVVDQPTGTALAALITSLGEGLAGHGDDVSAALEALQPALEQTDAVLRILGEQNELLGRLIDKTDPVAAALAAERGERLDAVVEAAARALRSLAAGRAGLESGLRQLPGTLDATRVALGQLTGLAQEANPVLASLRPLTGDLPGVVRELDAVAVAAQPALAALNPVLERAQRLIDAAGPVAAELAAAADDLEQVGRSSRTVIEALPVDLGELLDAVRDAMLATVGSDALGHYVRGFVLHRREAAEGAVAGTTPPTVPRPPPGPTAVVPDQPGRPAPRPAPDRPDPAQIVDDPTSATGLTRHQERSLLRYLMGSG